MITKQEADLRQYILAGYSYEMNVPDSLEDYYIFIVQQSLRYSYQVVISAP
jgi:hypothetical protein